MKKKDEKQTDAQATASSRADEKLVPLGALSAIAVNREERNATDAGGGESVNSSAMKRRQFQRKNRNNAMKKKDEKQKDAQATTSSPADEKLVPLGELSA